MFVDFLKILTVIFLTMLAAAVIERIVPDKEYGNLIIGAMFLLTIMVLSGRQADKE